MNERYTEHDERERRLLAAMIADLDEEAPPRELLPGVMAGIRPRRPSLARRLWRLVSEPRSFTLRPMVAAPLALALLLLALAPTLRDLARNSLTPSPEPARQAAFQPPAESLGQPRNTIPNLGQPLPADNAREVVFSFLEPEAEAVFLVGGFNDWRPDASPMRRAEDGRWTLALALPPGAHAYAFLVRDERGERLVADPQALLTQDDGFGGQNSLIIVDASHEQTT